MTFYPLLEIILYIALFFAPIDATHVTVTGPDVAMELTRNDTTWTTATTRFSVSDGVVTRQENSTRTTTRVADYVKAALNHDWSTAPHITLHDSTTLEKTASGFVIRVNDGDSAVRTYTLTYHRSTSPASPASSSRPLTINVLGAVNKPGAYPLPAGATLIDALAAAGGTNRHADTRKVSIVRGPAGEKPSVNVHDASTILRGQLANPPVLDRDTVFVPEKIL